LPGYGNLAFLGVRSAVDVERQLERGWDVTIPADLAAVIEQYHRAAVPFVRGDCEPYKAVFSHHEDVSVGNPFGPFRRGWEEVSATIERASALYRDGEVIGFENLRTHVTPDLAYIVEVEHYRARMGGRSEVTDVVLRATSILRPEDGSWRVVHRHADPITTERGVESLIHE
jgi:ketosteroid isomerase-like protein